MNRSLSVRPGAPVGPQDIKHTTKMSCQSTVWIIPVGDIGSLRNHFPARATDHGHRESLCAVLRVGRHFNIYTAFCFWCLKMGCGQALQLHQDGLQASSLARSVPVELACSPLVSLKILTDQSTEAASFVTMQLSTVPQVLR